jgi:RNA polymerase sigma factor (sigma-70 family)
MNIRELPWKKLLNRMDKDLARRGHKGASDNDLWTEVSRRINDIALRLLTGNARLRNDIGDVVQIVLIKLQARKTIAMLRAKNSPVAYVVVMVRHAAWDIARARQREEDRSERYRVSPELAGLMSRPVSGPESVESAELVQELKQALASLSKDERDLIEVRFRRGLSLRAIADVRGSTISATGTRMFRILRKLRAHLSASRYSGASH